MEFCRRRLLHLAAGAAVLPALSGFASAQTYPSRPVRIIVGFAAGGPNDILARLIGQWLSERLGRPFVIENRPGAGSNIATEAVVHATPDGYTLLLVGTPNAINATLYDNLNFNFIRDIVPIAGLFRGALVMVVHPSVPAKTLPEFIAYAKANPGKLSYGSGGVGGITHITAELFKQEAGGLDIVHVPYRGVAPALTDLLGGQVQVLAQGLGVLSAQAKGGKVRLLATTGTARSALTPDVPTVREAGVPGFEFATWFAVVAPAATPKAIVERLNAEIVKAANLPEVRESLGQQGYEIYASSPQQLDEAMREGLARMGKIIREGNIRAD